MANPDDLIRIAIFDIWVDNADGYSGNYNLLLKLNNGKLEVITIDHAFAFGGLKGMNIFNETSIPDTHKKSIGSRYFCSVINHINKKRRLEIANEFLSLIAQVDIQKIADEVFADIPAQWNVNETLKNRMVDFLQSGQRQKVLKQICYQQLQKNFRRKKS